jgi:hypothetical protein
MFCQQCGHKNSTEDIFCVSCGSQLGGQIDPNATTNTTASKPSQSKKVIAAVLGACLLAAGGFFLVMSNKQNEKLLDAVSSCEVEGKVNLAEDNKSFTFDGSAYDDYVGLQCILTTLNAPSTIWDRMTQTTALMGSISGDWDGISVSWTYHPDNGLDCYFQLSS